MANINFDFSNRELNVSGKNVTDTKTYIFRDINTSDFIIKTKDNNEYVKSSSTSFYDKSAVKNALNNILHFKTGEAILEPEFGIGAIYDYLYTPFDKYTTQKIIKTLTDILTRWEPRIQITSMPTSYNEDTHEFFIT